MSIGTRSSILMLAVIAATAGVASAQRVRPSISPAPVAPTGVAIAPAQPSGVTVSWQASIGAAQYQLLRTSDPAVPGVAVGAPTTATSATDPSPLPGVAYYQVVALALDGRQAPSALASYSPPAPAVNRVATAGGATASRLKGSAPAFAGVPPTSLAIKSFGPGNHRLTWRWDGIHVARWQVYLQTLPSTTWQLVKDQATNSTYDHRSFVAPNAATFRVVALYPDGTQGAAEIGLPNPPQPAPPAGLRGTQVSTGAIKFSWQYSPGAAGYRLTGPGIPGPGLAVGPISSQVVTGIPTGSHQFSIVSLYDHGLESAPASATATVLPTSGSYRVIIKGFRTWSGSNDDPLGVDGKGDEIFLAAYWAAYRYHDGTIKASAIVQSAVYGDANQAPNRIQAGSIPTMGGIQTGDVVPMYAVSQQPGIAAYPDRLPLLVWQGVLSDSGDAVGISPTIWESDRNSGPNLPAWQEWFKSPSGLEGFVSGVQSNAGVLKPLKPVPLSIWNGNAPVGGPSFTTGQGFDRPLGVGRVMNAFGRADDLPDGNMFAPLGVVLTRERIEMTLGTYPAMIVEFLYSDRLGLGGVYYLYLQIERLP